MLAGKSACRAGQQQSRATAEQSNSRAEQQRIVCTSLGLVGYGWIVGTRRKYVPVGSFAPSMALYGPANPPVPALESESVRDEERTANSSTAQQLNSPTAQQPSSKAAKQQSSRQKVASGKSARQQGSRPTVGSTALGLVRWPPGHCLGRGCVGSRDRWAPWMALTSLHGWIHGVSREPTHPRPTRNRRRTNALAPALAVAVAVAVAPALAFASKKKEPPKPQT